MPTGSLLAFVPFAHVLFGEHGAAVFVRDCLHDECGNPTFLVLSENAHTAERLGFPSMVLSVKAAEAVPHGGIVGCAKDSDHEGCHTLSRQSSPPPQHETGGLELR